MIICTHEVFRDAFNRTPCGKTARWDVPKIKQTTAGNVHAMQVCGVHRRFWLARDFNVRPIKQPRKATP